MTDRMIWIVYEVGVGTICKEFTIQKMYFINTFFKSISIDLRLSYPKKQIVTEKKRL